MVRLGVCWPGVLLLILLILSGCGGAPDEEPGDTDTVAPVEQTGGTAIVVGTVAQALNGPPSVASFSPTKAAQGATVTINGTNFVAGSSVAFNGTMATSVTYVSATRLRAVAPIGATTGPIGVTTPSGSGASVAVFHVLPKLVSVAPTQGFVGDVVTISGSGFSGATAVKFGAVAATSFSLTNDATIQTNVPSGAPTGKVSVVTPEGTVASASVFSVLPLLTSFTPSQGIVGTVVSLTGVGFSLATAVKFGTKSAAFTTVSDTAISATVPAGAGTAKITVETPRGNRASTTSFTVVKAPTISSFTPTSSVLPATLTITGSNFAGTTSVQIGSTILAASTVTNTQITAIVPLDAPGGPITVTNAAGSATSGASFIPIRCAPFNTGPGIVDRTVVIDGTDTAGDLAAIAGARCITGDLYVTTTTTLTDLSALAGLAEVAGKLEIGGTLPSCTFPCNSGNSSLTSLHGLETLQRVGGNLTVTERWEDPGIASLSGLAGLRQVGGWLLLDRLKVLPNLQGLEQIQSLGQLVVYSCPMLQTLNALESLRTSGAISLDSDGALSDISALRGLSTLNGDLYLSGLAVASLAGLENLTSVGGYVAIVQNPSLTDLGGLSHLTTAGSLSLYDNPGVTSLIGLSSLTNLGTSLGIDTMSIATLDGLQNLTEAGWQQVNISRNPNLVDLTALSNVLQGTQFLAVNENPRLVSLAGLEGPGGHVSSLTLANLPLVTSCAPIHVMNDASFNSDASLVDLSCLAGAAQLNSLSITDCDNLSTLEGLVGLTSIATYLDISGNDLLASLSGLRNLVVSPSLPIGVNVAENALLTDLTGLGGLASATSFVVRNNPALTSLVGVETLTSISYTFQVTDNVSLPPCALLPLETQVGRPADYDYGNTGTGSCGL